MSDCPPCIPLLGVLHWLGASYIHRPQTVRLARSVRILGKQPSRPVRRRTTYKRALSPVEKRGFAFCTQFKTGGSHVDLITFRSSVDFDSLSLGTRHTTSEPLEDVLLRILRSFIILGSLHSCSTLALNLECAWTGPLCESRIEGAPGARQLSSRRSYHLESWHPDVDPHTVISKLQLCMLSLPLMCPSKLKGGPVLGALRRH